MPVGGFGELSSSRALTEIQLWLNLNWFSARRLWVTEEGCFREMKQWYSGTFLDWESSNNLTVVRLRSSSCDMLKDKVCPER